MPESRWRLPFAFALSFSNKWYRAPAMSERENMMMRDASAANADLLTYSDSKGRAHFAKHHQLKRRGTGWHPAWHYNVELL